MQSWSRRNFWILIQKWSQTQGEVSRISPETSEGLEAARNPTQCGRGKGKSGEEGGTFHGRKVLRKTLAGEDRFCCLFVCFVLIIHPRAEVAHLGGVMGSTGKIWGRRVCKAITQGSDSQKY